MRIEHLLFERYGLFSDRRLSFHPEAALHVVLGPNEAGKTSALTGIGDLLFGFGVRTGYDFRHESKNLRIAGAFRHSDGRSFSARRRKGNKNTLVNDADQPLPDDTLAALLDGLTREAFNRDFGLTARALREGGEELLSAGGRLAETLAASSAGMTALSRVKDRLQGDADDLFTPRKSAGKHFYLAADRRDAADKKLRESIVTREALQQLQTDVAEAGAKKQSLTAAHVASTGNLARLQRTQRVRSHLARLDAIKADLAALAALPRVSEQSLADWRGAFDADATLSREIAALDATAASDAAEIAALSVDDSLLAEAGVIDELSGRAFVIDKDLKDLPRRRHDRDAAEAQLEEAARRLGLASYNDLLAQLPTDPALAQASSLIEKIKQAEQAIASATTRLARAQRELEDFAAEEGDAPALVDGEHLRQRFDALGDIPAQADRLRRDSAALGIETDALKASLASLNPSPGSFGALRALPLPDRATIDHYARALERFDNDTKKIADLIAAADTAIRATERELARLSRAGAVPTRSDLVAARRKRDDHLDGLQAVLDGEPVQRLARLRDVVTSTQAIDGLTDRLLDDTERAALFDDAQRRLIDSRAVRDAEIAKRVQMETDAAAFQTRWRDEWSASGLVPRSPADMLRWRDRLDEMVIDFGTLDLRKADIASITSRLAEGKVALLAFMDSVGRVADTTLPIDHLYREAKIRHDALQAAVTNARVRASEKKRMVRDIMEADAARLASETELAALRRAWPAAMAGIGQGTEATPTQAEAALAVWHDVPLPKASHEREGRSVVTMERDLAEFDHDVLTLIDRVSPDLKSLSAQESLARVATKLADARTASETSRRLQQNAAKRATMRKALLAQQNPHAAMLSEARRSLGLTDDAGLAEPLDQIARRHQLEHDLAARQRDLQEIGDGHDEAALRQEREGLDLDLLSGEIDRERLQQQQTLNEINEASAIQHQKQRDLDDMMKGRDAVSAAADRAEASAELLSIAERWLLRSAAARLASRAIEKHRAMVQDPLIVCAGALFATATGGAFVGLGVHYDEDGEPELKARRDNGAAVKIVGLSEGTRDQLFLALRLALLERRTSEPMPFIGDDLLASFDEARTLATLRLLADSGQRRQMILFTHHRHVADLAQSVKGRVVDVIEL